MGTLIILAVAILGGLACAKQTLYQSWIFLFNLAFSVYLAVLLAPVVEELAKPSLNLEKGMEIYLLPSIMLVLFLILIVLFYKITDAVITIDLGDYPIPVFANKIGAMAFSAFSGAILAAFLLSCFSLMPFTQNLPLDRNALADSGRNVLSSLVHTVNGFSMQGTSAEASKVLNNLAAYQPLPPGNAAREKEMPGMGFESAAGKTTEKNHIEKIDGKPVGVPDSRQAAEKIDAIPRRKPIEKIDGKPVEDPKMKLEEPSLPSAD